MSTTITLLNEEQTAEKVGLEGVKSKEQLVQKLMEKGFRYVDLAMAEEKPYPKAIAQMKGLALPKQAICVTRVGYVVHTEENPLPDDTKRGCLGVWTTDEEYSSAKFWEALRQNRMTIYGRDWNIDENGEVVWGENEDGEKKPRSTGRTNSAIRISAKAVIEEAQEEAENIIAVAKEHADKILAEAEEVKAAAKVEAKQIMDEAAEQIKKATSQSRRRQPAGSNR